MAAHAARRRRDILVALLAVTTGSVDAISFLRFGGVFTSVMTANMVLLGVTAGQQNGARALRTGVAFAGYILSALAASRFNREPAEPARVWPARVTATLAAEAVILLAVTAGWEAAGGQPRGAAQLWLLAAAAVAMGFQAAAVRALGEPGLSSTYLTGTLTSVLGNIAAGRGVSSVRRSVAILVLLVAGAAVSSVLVLHAPRVVPAVPVAFLLAVITVAASSRWPGSGGRP
ncbi:MAG TPA: YoaK family protein [Streptosporangiaceae bacterium]